MEKISLNLYVYIIIKTKKDQWYGIFNKWLKESPHQNFPHHLKQSAPNQSNQWILNSSIPSKPFSDPHDWK